MTYGVIVDGYSSGAELVHIFQKFGISCIHVQSNKIIPDVYLKTYNPSAYIMNFVFEDNLISLCKKLILFKPIFAITGSEPGVELADHIANYFELINKNAIQTSCRRRNKFLMQEQLKINDLASIPQIKSNSLPELLDWGKKHLINGNLIIKPLKSAGGDKVKICYTTEDIAIGYKEILTGKPNLLGLVDDEALLQKYIDVPGPEVAINSTHYNGSSTICEIWEFYKTICGSGKKIYDFADLRLPVMEDSALLEYVCKVAKVLGIDYGPMHAEVLIRPEGPILIEAAARLMGANIPFKLMKECISYPQAFMCALLYAQPENYLKLLQEKNILYKKARMVFLISNKSGKLIQIKNLKFITRLESFYDLKIRVNKTISATIDYDTSPGLIYLMHEDIKIIEKDFQTIRSLEKNMYEIQSE